MKKVMCRLETYYDSDATDTEKGVIQYLLNHTRDAVEMDIYRLSETCFCSPATIVRLCKKNGFSGYKELKRALVNDLNLNDELMKMRLPENAQSEDELIRSVLLKNIKAIQNTYSLCNADELCAVVKDMFQCQHLCLFGIGASFLVARDFQQKLERIGTHAILYEDVHMQMVTAENMTEQDCGILITYSGRTKEMIAVAEMLKRRGSSICSITQYSRNDVADLADRRLYVPKIEGPLRASASSSRISQLSVVDMLYHLYLEKAGQTEKDRIAATQQLLEKENY